MSALDVRRELEAYPVSPELRRQIEDLWPGVEARLSEEAAAQGKELRAADLVPPFTALLGVVWGLSQKGQEPPLPLTVVFADLFHHWVAQLPSVPGEPAAQKTGGAEDMSVEDMSEEEWELLLRSETLQAPPIPPEALRRESLYSDGD